MHQQADEASQGDCQHPRSERQRNTLASGFMRGMFPIAGSEEAQRAEKKPQSTSQTSKLPKVAAESKRSRWPRRFLG